MALALNIHVESIDEHSRLSSRSRANNKKILTGASHRRVLSTSRRQTIFLFTMRRGTLCTNVWNGFNLVSFNIGRRIYRSICLQAVRLSCLRAEVVGSKVGLEEVIAEASSCASSLTRSQALANTSPKAASAGGNYLSLRRNQSQ